MDWVTVTLIFCLAGSLAPWACVELLKSDPERKKTIRIMTRLLTIGQAVALFFAFLASALIRIF